MLRYRTQGILAVGLGFAAVACSDPEIRTDLRPDGPPEVLALLAQSQVDLGETAVFCKYDGETLDPKAPGFVGDPVTGGSVVCPPTRAEFTAGNTGAPNFAFAIRVMFDELLEGDKVETLDCVTGDDGIEICSGSLATTQPLGITCGAAGSETVLPYEGYYVPNGNRVSFPVGPSIYALPDFDGTAFATGTPCRVTIDGTKVQDKEGNSVDAGQSAIDFSFAELALIGVEPPDGNGVVIQPSGAAEFIFNASIDDASLDPATEVRLVDANGTVVPFAAEVDDFNATADAIYVYPTGTWRPGTYTASITAGASFMEVNGGTIDFAAAESTTFDVAFGRIGSVPANNGTIGTTGGTLTFYLNDSLDPASVTADEFELVDFNNRPVPFTVTVVTDDLQNDAIQVTPTGTLAPTAPMSSQRYNLRVKAAAVFTSTGGKNLRGPFTLSFRVA